MTDTNDQPLIDAPEADRLLDEKRKVEALLFAAVEPVPLEALAERLPHGANIEACLDALEEDYKGRGVELVRLAGRAFFRTASDLAFLLRKDVEETRKLSRAGVETLAIIAYHQPVTRAEIEEIRGVSISKGTLDVLMEAGWVRPKGRKRTPGRPVTYATTDEFLLHFGIESRDDLPGMSELKAAGLLESVEDALSTMRPKQKAPDDDKQIDLEDAIRDDEKSAGEALRQPAEQDD